MSPEYPVARIANPIEEIQADLDSTRETPRARIAKKVAGAAVGSIPWVGPFIQAGMDYKDEQGQLKINELHRRWFEEHAKRFKELGLAIAEVLSKVEAFDEEMTKRLESEEFLGIVGKAFRSWDQAETREKREMLRFLLANAAGTKLCEDDIVRLFIEWIDKYHEIHFRVVRIVYKNAGFTRHDIWQELSGETVREDSAEAGLFRLLIDELSQGRIIQQHREVNSQGQFLAKTPQRGRSIPGLPKVLKSSFDQKDLYELSALGKQFVHYTMKDFATKIGHEAPEPIVTPPPPPVDAQKQEANEDAGISFESFDEPVTSDYGPSPWESDTDR